MTTDTAAPPASACPEPLATMSKLRTDLKAAETASAKLTEYRPALDELITKLKDQGPKLIKAQAEAKEALHKAEETYNRLLEALKCQLKDDATKLDKCRDDLTPDPAHDNCGDLPHRCVWLCCDVKDDPAATTDTRPIATIKACAEAKKAEAKRLVDLPDTLKAAVDKLAADLAQLEADVCAGKNDPRRSYLVLLDLGDALKTLQGTADANAYSEAAYLKQAREAVKVAIAWYHALACAWAAKAADEERAATEAECKGSRDLIDEILECLHDETCKTKDPPKDPPKDEDPPCPDPTQSGSYGQETKSA